LVKLDNTLVEEKLGIINKTREKAFGLDFSLVSRMKDDILGKEYRLSVAYVSEKVSKEFNTRYRNKNKSTNILSFQIEKDEGELIICPAVVKREAKNFDKNIPDFLGFLIIHGMLHLKEYDHGSIMEREEKKYDQKYFGRDRYRLDEHKSDRRRILKRRNKS